MQNYPLQEQCLSTNDHDRDITRMRQRRQLPPHYLAFLIITFGLIGNRVYQTRKIAFFGKGALESGTALGIGEQH